MAHMLGLCLCFRQVFLSRPKSISYSAKNCGHSLILGLVVGSVRYAGTGWVRKNPDMIRGVMVRRAGQASAFADPDHIREAYNAL